MQRIALLSFTILFQACSFNQEENKATDCLIWSYYELIKDNEFYPGFIEGEVYVVVSNETLETETQNDGFQYVSHEINKKQLLKKLPIKKLVCAERAQLEVLIEDKKTILVFAGLRNKDEAYKVETFIIKAKRFRIRANMHYLHDSGIFYLKEKWY